jgi:hypothetical protein
VEDGDGIDWWGVARLDWLQPGVPERRDDLSDDQKEKHFFGKDELVRITLFIERMS